MHYKEALLYLGYKDTIINLSKQYKGTSWGVYTQYQSDAKLLAISFGNIGAPEIHGIGYYGHYHDRYHGFHIWFGMPLE